MGSTPIRHPTLFYGVGVLARAKLLFSYLAHLCTTTQLVTRPVLHAGIAGGGTSVVYL